MRPYHHKPLEANHIRLIKLQPSSRTGRHLVALIEAVSLSIADGTYEALSYAWGDPTYKPCRLLCGDGSFLSISTNLYQALRSLRNEKETRLLWVDSVCIYQDDLTEKSRQVSQMAQIYAKAKKAVVFLGEEREGAEAGQEESRKEQIDSLDIKCGLDSIHDSRTNAAIAVDFLDAIPGKIRRITADKISEMRQNPVLPIPDQTTPERRFFRLVESDSEKLLSGFPREKTLRALGELLARPWFQRTWVIQEFVVARDVEMFVGRRKFEWQNFILMVSYTLLDVMVRWTPILKNNERLRAEFCRGQMQMWGMCNLRVRFHDKKNQKDRRQRLSLLLANFRAATATHAVDKVYALLGLSDDFDDYQTDYTKSKTEVYSHIAKCMIAKSQLNNSFSEAKETLYEAARSDRRGEDLPSWVPDWTEVPIRIDLSKSWSNSGKWGAGGEQTLKGSKPVLEIDGNVLKCMGFVFGTIVDLGETEDENARGRPPNVTRIRTVVREMLEICNRWKEYPTGEDIVRVMHIILEVDQNGKKDSPSITTIYDDKTTQDMLLELLVEELGEGQKALPDTATEKMAQYLKAADQYRLRNISSAIGGRRLAVTTKAYAGLVPTATQRGDKIVILQGFGAPFVMRRTSAGKFVLVGDCYVHGIMQGEAFNARKPPVMRMIEIH
jgi:Heterokaryon incompatibility protein (HET)